MPLQMLFSPSNFVLSGYIILTDHNERGYTVYNRFRFLVQVCSIFFSIFLRLSMFHFLMGSKFFSVQTMGLPVEICLDMKEEVERMKEEVKGMKEEVEDMSDKIGVLTRKAEAMKKEIEDKSKRIEGLKEEVKGMEEEVEVLAKKDKVMKEDIEDKKKNVKDKSAKIEGIERKIEVTKKKIEVLKKSLEKYIHSALPVSKKILQSAVKVVASEPLLDHSDAAIPFWKEAYYSLVMLEKILNCFHDLCFERDLEVWTNKFLY